MSLLLPFTIPSALVQLAAEEYNVTEGSGTVTVCATVEGFGFSVTLFTTDETAEGNPSLLYCSSPC